MVVSRMEYLKTSLKTKLKDLETAVKEVHDCPILKNDVLPIIRLLVDIVIELDEKPARYR